VRGCVRPDGRAHLDLRSSGSVLRSIPAPATRRTSFSFPCGRHPGRRPYSQLRCLRRRSRSGRPPRNRPRSTKPASPTAAPI